MNVFFQEPSGICIQVTPAGQMTDEKANRLVIDERTVSTIKYKSTSPFIVSLRL